LIPASEVGSARISLRRAIVSSSLRDFAIPHSSVNA
jgi:hypothetical protein